MSKDNFTKHDSNKPRPELIPRGFIMLLAEVFAYGARKYDDHNWVKCEDHTRYVGAALRHLLAYHDGEDLDPESGLHHLGHAAASVAMLYGLTLDSVGTFPTSPGEPILPAADFEIGGTENLPTCTWKDCKDPEHQ